MYSEISRMIEEVWERDESLSHSFKVETKSLKLGRA